MCPKSLLEKSFWMRWAKSQMLTCEMCLGEGTGAVAAFPVLEMANAVYTQMSTFSEIEIEDYQPLS